MSLPKGKTSPALLILWQSPHRVLVCPCVTIRLTHLFLGRSLITAQRALDRLLSSRNLKETVAQDDKESIRAEVDCPTSQIPITQGRQPPSITQRYDLSVDQLHEQQQDALRYQENRQDIVPGLEERLTSRTTSKRGSQKSLLRIVKASRMSPPYQLKRHPSSWTQTRTLGQEFQEGHGGQSGKLNGALSITVESRLGSLVKTLTQIPPCSRLVYLSHSLQAIKASSRSTQKMIQGTMNPTSYL